MGADRLSARRFVGCRGVLVLHSGRERTGHSSWPVLQVLYRACAIRLFVQSDGQVIEDSLCYIAPALQFCSSSIRKWIPLKEVDACNSPGRRRGGHATRQT